MTLYPLDWIAFTLALLVVLLPGVTILAWFPVRRRGLLEFLATAFGLGLSVIALGALLGRLAGFRFSLPVLAAVILAFGAALIAGLARRKMRFRLTAFSALEIFTLAALLALRFFQIRGLAFPAWVDSVHHTFLVRLFLERQGIPADLLPWIPGPFYYHFGFHAATAVVAAFSNFSPDRAVLVFGQIINAAVALSVYRLSLALRVDRRRALLAMAVAGFITQMPAFYLSWGRYTLLTGLVLLPLAMAEAIEFAARAPRPGTAVRLTILTAGVLLTHYLAGILLALFLLLIGAYCLIQRNRRNRFLGLAASVAAGTVLALPWIVPVLRYSAGGIDFSVISPTDSVDGIYFAGYTTYLWNLLGPLRDHLLLAAGLIAALVALFRRGPLRIFAVWGLILAVQTLPWGLRVTPFRPDHLAIVLFLPASILVADGFILLLDTMDRRWPAFHWRYLFAGIAAACCLIGVWETRTIVRPATVLADSDDRRAIEWAAANTPADAVFMINVAPWQNGLYRGVDGGWWLLPAAGRTTLLPPMLYSFSNPAFIDQVDDLAARVSTLKGCSEDFWSLVREQNVTYIYVREGAGSLQPGDLDSCQGVEEVFRAGSVRIYRVDPAGQSDILPPTGRKECRIFPGKGGRIFQL
jgi:hypothetical protein